MTKLRHQPLQCRMKNYREVTKCQMSSGVLPRRRFPMAWVFSTQPWWWFFLVSTCRCFVYLARSQVRDIRFIMSDQSPITNHQPANQPSTQCLCMCMGLAGSMFHFWCPVPVHVRTNTQTCRKTNMPLQQAASLVKMRCRTDHHLTSLEIRHGRHSEVLYPVLIFMTLLTSLKSLYHISTPSKGKSKGRNDVKVQGNLSNVKAQGNRRGAMV